MSSELIKNEAASNIFAVYAKAFRNYFRFSGRTCRYDYWAFTLVNLLVSLLLSIVGSIGSFLAYMSMIYGWLVLVPSTAIQARRLHDVNKSFSKWFILPLVLLFLLIFISRFLGQAGSGVILILAGLFFVFWGITLIVFTCRKGNPESNEYGEPIVESQSQDKKAKWLIFLLCILPAILLICALIVGGISGYLSRLWDV